MSDLIGKIILSLVVATILTSCSDDKVGTNSTKEIKNTPTQFNYPNIIPLPYKFDINKVNVENIKNVIVKPIKKIKYETFEITAYTANEESTSKRKGHPLYGITASGEKVKENYTIACPRSIPFQTKIYIPYFKNTFTCTDRGGMIKKGHIDVYMKSYDKAMEFGRQKLEIHIVGEDGV